MLPARVIIGGQSPTEETEETLWEVWVGSGCVTVSLGGEGGSRELGKDN